MSAQVEMVARRPTASLTGLVDGYRGYQFSGFEPGTHQGLPSRYLTTIFSLDEPVDITTMPDPTQSPRAFGAFTGGLHASPATVRHEGTGTGIHVDIGPLGALMLFGLPAGVLANTVVDLADVLGGEAGRIHEQLAEATSWDERFAILDRSLVRVVATRTSRRTEPDREVSWAWRQMLTTGGAVEIGALAAEVGWSRRHLLDRFQYWLGLSPKVAARVLRFERACRLLRSSAEVPLAEAAAVAGYYDQAHMTREFREFAGCTPAAWLLDEMTDEFSSVQDDPEALPSR